MLALSKSSKGLPAGASGRSQAAVNASLLPYVPESVFVALLQNPITSFENCACKVAASAATVVNAFPNPFKVLMTRNAWRDIEAVLSESDAGLSDGGL